MAKEWTTQQRSFVEYLLNEAKGNQSEAARLAGYSLKTAPSSIAKTCEDLIQEELLSSLRIHGVRAVLVLKDILENEINRPGAKIKLDAATQVLDRIGITKTENINLRHSNDGSPIIELPQKTQPKTN